MLNNVLAPEIAENVITIDSDNLPGSPPEGLEDLAEDIANTTIIAIEKAIAHRANPAEFPISPSDKMVQAALELYDAADKPDQETAKQAVIGSVNRASSERTKEFGPMAQINLRSAKNVRQQAEAVQTQLNRDISVATLERLVESTTDLTTLKPINVTGQVLNPGINPANLDFDLQANATIIELKYKKLGGVNGPLGKKLGKEKIVKDGKGRKVRMQAYQNGQIHYGPVKNEAFAVIGKSAKAFNLLGGLKNFSAAISDTKPTKNNAQVTHFVSNTSLYDTDKGLFLVKGVMHNQYKKKKMENGPCGLPVSDEQILDKDLKKLGKSVLMQKFQNGAIVFNEEKGARFIPAALLDFWLETGGLVGPLGYPLKVPAPSLIPVAGGTKAWKMSCQGGTLLAKPGGLISVSKPFQKVDLQLKKGKCIKKTKLEFGQDDIHMGVMGIGFNGQPIDFGKFKVGDFKKGETITFTPPKSIASFDVNQIQMWPTAATCILSVAEIDGGHKFHDFLTKLWQEVKKWVEKQVEKAVKALGEVVSAAVKSKFVGFLVSVTLGAIAKYLLGKLWNLLHNLFKDYVFPPFAVPLELKDIFALGSDKKGPNLHYFVKGNGGHYTWDFEFGGEK